MMLRTSRKYVEQAFAPQVFGGMGYMGVLDAKEAARLISEGAGPTTEAWKAYYGPGGYYSQSESVKDAAAAAGDTAHAGGNLAAPPTSMPVPQLYPARECGPTDGACIASNQQVQAANMAIMENARRAYNLQVCEFNAQENPENVRIPCSQYTERVPEPPAPGQKQTAVCTGGSCYTPIVGGVAQNEKLAQETFQAQYSPTGTALKPNQAVPPRPQAGEVPTGDRGASTPGGTAPEFSLPFGLSGNTLLIAGAALMAVFMFQGKG